MSYTKEESLTLDFIKWDGTDEAFVKITDWVKDVNQHEDVKSTILLDERRRCVEVQDQTGLHRLFIGDYLVRPNNNDTTNEFSSIEGFIFNMVTRVDG